MENKKYHIGIDLGGSKIAAGVVSKSGKLIAKYSIPTYSKRGYAEIITDMSFAALKSCEVANISIDDVDGIGVGYPGIIDSANGVLVYASNFNFQNVSIRDELRKHIDLPVFLSNDSNCAALGETGDSGAAKGYKNVILITLGTGLGGGIIVDGKIYEGENGAGAELGHTVIVVDGVQCACGRKGCWECYASASGLIRMTREALTMNKHSIMWGLIGEDFDRITGQTAFVAARRNDALALKVVYDYVKYLSEGIINMMNIFRPEIFLIGGGICNEGDYLFNPVREYVEKYLVHNNNIPVPKIIKAKLGSDAGIIGAAMMVAKEQRLGDV